MDLHPIVVHFPIALLSLYAVFELIRFKKVIDQPYWFYIKAILLICGTLGSYVAILTGPEGEHSILKERHEMFAQLTSFLFTIISSGYLYKWYKPFNRYSAFIQKPAISIILAFLGLVTITITGGLGGALVYGTHFDPFMAPIFKLLGVY